MKAYYEYWNSFNINEKIIPGKNIYRLVNNKVYIFYAIEYIFPTCINHLREMKTRDTIRLSLKITGFKLIDKNLRKKYNINYEVCEFCHLAKNNTRKIEVADPPIIICEKCFEQTNPKKYANPNQKYNYYLSNNNDVCKRIGNSHIEYIKSANGKLICFYSVFKDSGFFNYVKLLTQAWYTIPNGNNCQWCNNNEKYLLGSCKQCYNYIFDNFYSTLWIKWDYFKLICSQYETMCVDIQHTIFDYFCKLTNIDTNIFVPNKKQIKEKIEFNTLAITERVEEKITEEDLYEFYSRLNDNGYENDDVELINYNDSDEDCYL